MENLPPEARFVRSCPNLEDCPAPDRAEFALIGRSNVGKSSLLNLLMGRKNLAKTSGTPGKTQLLNYFEVDAGYYLVDMPGYGFARVPKAIRSGFESMIWTYLKGRESLTGLLILIDLRHPPQTIDLRFIEKTAREGVPFVLVFTKADKLGANARKAALADYQAQLAERFEPLPRHFVTSSLKNWGQDELLDFLESTASGAPEAETDENG